MCGLLKVIALEPMLLWPHVCLQAQRPSQKVALRRTASDLQSACRVSGECFPPSPRDFVFCPWPACKVSEFKSTNPLQQNEIQSDTTYLKKEKTNQLAKPRVRKSQMRCGGQTEEGSRLTVPVGSRVPQQMGTQAALGVPGGGVLLPAHPVAGVAGSLTSWFTFHGETQAW